MFTDTYAVKRFAEIVKEYGIRTLVETGTHLGVGALKASEFVPLVITMEINPDYAMQAMCRWQQQWYNFQWLDSEKAVLATRAENQDILLYLGDSRIILRSFTNLKRPAFYLDAHWGELPLLGELDAIAERGFKDSPIIFHDFEVPGNPNLRADEYDGQKLSYEFVKEHLNRINPDYRIEYNSESSTGIGIMYALPPRI